MPVPITAAECAALEAARETLEAIEKRTPRGKTYHSVGDALGNVSYILTATADYPPVETAAPALLDDALLMDEWQRIKAVLVDFDHPLGTGSPADFGRVIARFTAIYNERRRRGLVAAAAEASERFGDDECERWAAEHSPAWRQTKEG